MTGSRPPDLVTPSRLIYTKGMRASLELLLRDPELPEDAREIVETHKGYTEAIISDLEQR